MARPARNREFDTRGEKIGQSAALEISLDGDADVSRPALEVIDGPSAGDKAARLAFLEEPVTIVVNESTDPNAEDPISVSVNGRQVFIKRGEPVIVKRKYVERLARAKRQSFTQDLQNTDPQRYNKLFMHTALLYPFSVVEDRNPNGLAWLRKILAEPA